MPEDTATAVRIAFLAQQHFLDRASHVDEREWSSADSARRFAAFCRRGTAWAESATSVAAAASTVDGVWGYIAAEALDVASLDFDLPNARINQVQPGFYTLRWDAP